MINRKNISYILIILLFTCPISKSDTKIDKTKKSDIKEDKSFIYKDIVHKEHFLIFNIEASSIHGTIGEDIKSVDKTPFAKVIFGGFVSFDKIYSLKYSIGGNAGYLLNTVNDVRSHAVFFSGNFSYFLKGFAKSSTYIKTELGFTKAKTSFEYNNQTYEDISTNYIPFYKLGLGTLGFLGNFGALRFELFYKHVLSDNKKVNSVDNYKINGNLSTIGFAVGLGLSW